MKKFLSLVLALVMTMSLVTISAGAKDFTDADKVTYTEAVDVISAVKVVDGYTDGAFNPQINLNRGQAAKIICNMILGPTTAAALSADAAPFSDVPANHWAAGYIAYCAQQGIISGYTDGTFRPTGTLTGYQFMKMLLGALGYDKTVEGYDGANWSINVAKQALAIGLDKGNDEFNGKKPVTREEACLYAFNAMKAVMVDYSSKVEVNTGDSVVTISGGRYDVKNTVDEDKETVKGDGLMQFAEKYFSKLVLTEKVDEADVSDDFMRPAHTWTYKKDEVGTYTDTPDVIYTEETELGTIYADLGLSKKLDDVTVYEDGVYDSTVSLTRGDEDNKLGDNGVVIEVYKDSKVIVMVNTFVGEIASVEEATKKADAYVVVAPKADGETLDKDTFETEDFEEDDIVLYTYSKKDGVEGIKSLALAETVEGEVEAYKLGKSFTMGGETYKYSANGVSTIAKSDIGCDIVAYVDEYGYVILVEDSEINTANYALVLKAGVDSARGGEDKWAKLLYTDGTTEMVTTDKIYGTDGNLEKAADTNLVGYWVTFKTNSKDKVVLTKAVGDNQKLVADTALYVENNKTAVKDVKGGNTKFYANTNTIFIVYNEKSEEYEVFTGIKEVPSIDSSKADFAVLTKADAKYAFLVYVSAAGKDISTATNKTIFLRGASSKLEETKDMSYYMFDAVVNGEITEVALDASDDKTVEVINKLCKKDNVLLTTYAKDTDDLYTVDSADIVTGTDGANAVTDVEKVSGSVVILGGNRYVLADDCAIYKISAAGKLTASSITALRTAGSTYYAQVSYTLNTDGEVNAIYFELK